MIRLNKLTEYSLRVFRAMHLSGESPMSSVKIREAEGIPGPMLMKVLHRLKEVGFVSAFRGRGDSCGGYATAIDVEGMSLLEFVESIEGPVQIGSCMSTADTCCRRSDCMIAEQLAELNCQIRNNLAGIPLVSMLEGGMKSD